MAATSGQGSATLITRGGAVFILIVVFVLAHSTLTGSWMKFASEQTKVERMRGKTTVHQGAAGVSIERGTGFLDASQLEGVQRRDGGIAGSRRAAGDDDAHSGKWMNAVEGRRAANGVGKIVAKEGLAGEVDSDSVPSSTGGVPTQSAAEARKNKQCVYGVDGDFHFVDRAQVQLRNASAEEGSAGKRPMQWRTGNPQCPLRRFDTETAWECLEGKFFLMYGNSNTRVLYTALEALLKDTTMMSRVAAKQMCDNSKRNHSCWQTVERPGRRPIELFYWGYIRDIYHRELGVKMKNQRHADYVIGNTGSNFIQTTGDGAWEQNFRLNVDNFQKFVDSFTSKKATKFFWHTTTPLCPKQKHFTRYSYVPKYWKNRPLEAMNVAMHRYNRMVAETLDEAQTKYPSTKGKITVVDAFGMISGVRSRDASFSDARDVTHTSRMNRLCPYYDDPIHHRFLDVEVIQVLLNEICPHIGETGQQN